MRAEVVVLGDVDCVDLWPYCEVVERNGPASVLAVKVHDSQEFVLVLSSLLAHGLHVTRAQLLDDAAPDSTRI
ncbi:hypothetical protein [Humibacillus xanthopallidus]|uniref:hypothetical protein n=1 Tax=Humibacillus xanthopallidus TaxID=412689 RepID=UPI003850FA1F